MLFENTFENLSDNQVEQLDEYFDSFDYNSAGHTLVGCYIWRKAFKTTWQIIEGYLMISSVGESEDGKKECYMSFPLTNTGKYDAQSVRKAILTARDIYADYTDLVHIGPIPEVLLPVLKEAADDLVEVTHDRGDDEYVYLRESLATLKGRKLHNKKNHLNQFLKTYEYTYEEINEKNLAEVEEFILAKNDYILQDTPKKYRDILEFETGAIEELLHCTCRGRMLTGAIRIDGKIVAATIGEYANTKKHDNVIVHVEKADDRFRGLYQAINWEFVRHLPEDVIYVNREEDMGLLSLRRAKEGYNPHHMAKKYIATIRVE